MKRKYSVLALACLMALLGVLAIAATGCGSDLEAPDSVATPGQENRQDLTSAAELPGDYAQLQPGMTRQEVRDLLGYADTIQLTDNDADRQLWKYFIDEGNARLFLQFGQDQLQSMYTLTP